MHKLSEQYPDLIRTNPLTGFDFQSKNMNEGHSLFIYEINVIESKAFLHREYTYNYNKNTINTMTSNPQLSIHINFNPIAIEYEEGEENFWEFLTYTLGMTGGIVSMIRILYNMIYKIVMKDRKYEEIPISDVN